MSKSSDMIVLAGCVNSLGCDSCAILSNAPVSSPCWWSVAGHLYISVGGGGPLPHRVKVEGSSYTLLSMGRNLQVFYYSNTPGAGRSSHWVKNSIISKL